MVPGVVICRDPLTYWVIFRAFEVSLGDTQSPVVCNLGMNGPFPLFVLFGVHYKRCFLFSLPFLYHHWHTVSFMPFYSPVHSMFAGIRNTSAHNILKNQLEPKQRDWWHSAPLMSWNLDVVTVWRIHFCIFYSSLFIFSRSLLPQPPKQLEL